MIIERLNKIDSTNNYIEKYVKKRENSVVTADCQTGGKGTKGRSFVSEKGGLYMSRLTFYDFFPAKDAFKIMIDYSVGVVKTLKAFNVNAVIKWPNDVLVFDKKICGILIKNSFSGDFIDYSLVGVGININNPIGEDIKDIAISTEQILGKKLNINAVLFTLLKNLEEGSSVEEYRGYSTVIGKKVTVIKGEKIYEAVAEDILSDGRLKLKSGEILSAAELDLKIKI